jgi:hypothetical protein
VTVNLSDLDAPAVPDSETTSVAVQDRDRVFHDLCQVAVGVTYLIDCRDRGRDDSGWAEFLRDRISDLFASLAPWSAGKHLDGSSGDELRAWVWDTLASDLPAPDAPERP